MKFPAERVKIDDVEEWVDAVLDEHDAGAWEPAGYSSWREYANDRFGRPPFLDLNRREFDARAFQDALVWLYDGGLKVRDISQLLHIPRFRLQTALEQIEDEYEDEAL